jgi:hypothetical protein
VAQEGIKLSAAIGRPVTFALTQNDHDPDAWYRMLELCAEARAEGANVRPQVAGRPVMLLLGLQTFHPFAYCPSWAPIGAAPLPEKVAAMRDPELRRRLLGEVDDAIAAMRQFLDPERNAEVVGKPVPKKYPRTEGVYKEWIAAIKGGTQPGSNFSEHAGPLTEMIVLGNLAVRSGRMIELDPETGALKTPGIQPEWILPTYRNGWTL